MNTLLQDLRYGLRTLSKRPGFTAVAVAALALGIGANSAIFSVVNAVILRPFPYPEPERILFLEERSGQMESMSVSWQDYQDWQAQASVFQAMGLYRRDNFNLTSGSEPERVRGRMVTASFLPILGVKPMLGRLIAPDEDQPGAPPVVLLSQPLWQRRFGGDPSLVGKTVNLDGRETTVIGVLPADFRFFYRADVVVPLGPVTTKFTDRGSHPGLVGLVRLKPGVSAEQARSELDAIATLLEKQYPDTNTGLRVNLTPLAERLVGDFRNTALVLLGAVGFVLLIACANVANLLLARAAARRKEIAIRTAVGAARSRIVRQLLTESLLLSLLGGLAGVLVASWGVDLLVSLQPGSVPRLEEIGVDGTVFGFTLGLSMLSSVLFGLAPALQASRAEVSETLKEGGKTGAGQMRHRARALLVVTETALSTVLLVGAGLMLRSFVEVQRVDPRFDSSHLLTLQMSLRPDRYSESAPILDFYRQLLERTSKLAGANASAIGARLPLEGGGSETSFWFEGRPEPGPGEFPEALYNIVSPDYFQALRISVQQGRAFTPADGPNAPRVIVIDEALAQKFFPQGDALGKRIAFDRDEASRFEIVGIVPHIAHYSLEGQDAVPYQVYFHYPQLPERRLVPGLQEMNLFVRTAGDPVALAPAVRAELHAVDPEQPVYNVRAMDEVVSEAMGSRRFNLVTLGVFAGVAMLLAAVGIYGVMAFSVSQRTHEIGVRMALGAHRSDVLRLVVGQGMRLALAGVALGVGLGLLLSRVLRGMVFRVSPFDPLTFAVVAGLLAGVALLACAVPARRASRVDPMVALRHE
jgi:putative ABC transport system permease protein